MDIETNDGVDTPEENQEQQATNNSNQRFASIEDAIAEMNKLQKNLENSRKGEKFAKSELQKLKEAAEGAAELQSNYEAAVEKAAKLEAKLRNGVIEGALKSALSDAKAKSVSTVMKLVNRDEIKINEDDTVDTDSLMSIITKIKSEDPILFEEVEAPDVKRSAEGAVVGSFEKELKAAKSQKEIEAVLRKHGKM